MPTVLGTLPAAARALGYWTGLAGRALRRASPDRILVLHGTPAADAARLEDQLRYLKRSYPVVPLAEIVAALDEPSGQGGRVALTFDDGLRNNVGIAYPILKRLGLPATFFVCPAVIDQGGWLWTHEARRRLHHLGIRDVEASMRCMKAMPIAVRREVEDALRKATPAWKASAAEHHAFDVATWAELRSLDAGLISVGSHTATHPMLASLDEADCELEIAGSARRIEEALQRRPAFFAYPNGEPTPLARLVAARHFRAAVSDGDACVDSGCDRFDLPRFNVPRGVLRLANVMHRGGMEPTSRIEPHRRARARSRETAPPGTRSA